MPQHRPIRVVCATRQKSGRAVFNQVVILKEKKPRGVLLVAVVPDEGLRLWMRPFSVLEPHTKEQHEGYSPNLSFNLDRPPDHLGEPVLIPAADVDDAEAGPWDRIGQARTNTKNKLVRELFGFEV